MILSACLQSQLMEVVQLKGSGTKLWTCCFKIVAARVIDLKICSGLPDPPHFKRHSMLHVFFSSSSLTHQHSHTYVLLCRMRDERNTDGTSHSTGIFFHSGTYQHLCSSSPQFTHVLSALVTMLYFYRFWNRKSLTPQTRSSRESKSDNFPAADKLVHSLTFFHKAMIMLSG